MEVARAKVFELSEVDGTDEEIADAVTRSNELMEQLTALDKERLEAVDYEKRVEAVRALAIQPAAKESGDGATVTRSAPGPKSPEFMEQIDPFDADPMTLSKSDAISRARTFVDNETRVPVTDDAKEHLHRLLTRSMLGDDEDEQFDSSYIARRTLLTENPFYRAAYKKYWRLGSMAQYNQDESRAIAAYQDYELRRAASENTTTAGGFGVPVIIDPTILITSGAIDAPLLRVCSIEQVTNNIWKGVSSAGMVWSYDTEAAEVSDDAATLAQPSVTVHMARGYVPYSIEVGQDYPGFAMEMGKLLNQGFTDLIASKTMTGSGTGEPFGIFTALDANTNVEVTPTTDGSFGGVDVFKVWNALPERYRGRATWVMSVHVESAIRQFAAAAGSSSAYFTVDLTADGVSRINGRPVIVTDYAPTFSGSVPGTTGAANILIVMDCSNYKWVQRAGMSVEQVPLVIGSSGQRPTGQRGMFAWARNGGDSVNDLGGRLLQNQ
jgi:HK97 family phage major capsid protein